MESQGFQAHENITKIYPRNTPISSTDVSQKFGNNKIVAVGIIGSSFFGKASILNSITETMIFSDLDYGSGYEIKDTEGTSIYIYQDTIKNIIYIQLISFFDQKLIDLQLNEILKNDINSVDFHQWLDKSELQGYKALLYIFLISHFILVNI